MYGRHFVRCSPGQVIVILAAALLIHHPFTANAQVRPEVSAGLLLGMPSGDFGDNVSDNGIGFVITGGIQLPESPVLLGVELGYLVYGHTSRSEAFNAMTPDVMVDVVTNNNIFLGNFFLRLQPGSGKIRPYIDGLVGFKYLFTETSVNNARDWIFDRMAYYVNFDDSAFTYGVGVGAAITLWEHGSQLGPVSKEPIGVSLDVGLRYMLGTEAEYLKEGSILIVGDQATFQPEKSKTDMIHPHFRISVAF